MDQQHPITPPPELVQQWICECDGLDHIATQAARWGADAELEACCEWMESHFHGRKEWGDALRAARRPKPPTLAEQALAELDLSLAKCYIKEAAGDTIRVALERLQQLEQENHD